MSCGWPAGSEAIAVVPRSRPAFTAVAHAAGTAEPVRVLLAKAASREQEALRHAADKSREPGLGRGDGAVAPRPAHQASPTAAAGGCGAPGRASFSLQKALWWEHSKDGQQKIIKTTENKVWGHTQTAMVVFHLEHGPHKARKLPGETAILAPHSSHRTVATTLAPQPTRREPGPRAQSSPQTCLCS